MKKRLSDVAKMLGVSSFVAGQQIPAKCISKKNKGHSPLLVDIGAWLKMGMLNELEIKTIKSLNAKIKRLQENEKALKMDLNAKIEKQSKLQNAIIEDQNIKILNMEKRLDRLTKSKLLKALIK